MDFRHYLMPSFGVPLISIGFLLTYQFVEPVNAQSVQPLQYFAVPPCRIADTRNIASPLGANTVRAFRATGSDFSSQGGTSGSCNIPSGASSVFFNFTATKSQAVGSLSAYPYDQNNSTPPNSSILNYGRTLALPAIANGIAVAICMSATTVCNNDFYISANHGTTDLIVDVVGYYAPDIGNGNSTSGYQALQSNTTGSYNTANGDNALQSNTTGSYNTANGYSALQSNTTGVFNTAVGGSALGNSTTGNYNTAFNYALTNNTTGGDNTAIGGFALYNNTTGSNNTALGKGAGFNLTTGSNNVDIANQGEQGDSGVIRIGTALFDGSPVQTSTYIAGISGVSVLGVPVVVSSNGQLGVAASSRRFKRNINNIGNLSDRLLKLRPVSFRYKQPTEQGAHPLQYGLIAEEVAKVFPELVQYDKEGKPFTVYYHLLAPLLLGEVQRQQFQLATERTQLAALRSKDQTQQAEITRLRQQLSTLQAQQEQMLKAVSTRLNNLERVVEVNGKAPQAPTTVLTAVPSASR